MRITYENIQSLNWDDFSKKLDNLRVIPKIQDTEDLETAIQVMEEDNNKILM